MREENEREREKKSFTEKQTGNKLESDGAPVDLNLRSDCFLSGIPLSKFSHPLSKISHSLVQVQSSLVQVQ